MRGARSLAIAPTASGGPPVRGRIEHDRVDGTGRDPGDGVGDGSRFRNAR